MGHKGVAGPPYRRGSGSGDLGNPRRPRGAVAGILGKSLPASDEHSAGSGPGIRACKRRQLLLGIDSALGVDTRKYREL
jgi:hypothetical protein